MMNDCMRLFHIYIGHKDPGWFQYINIAQIMFTSKLMKTKWYQNQRMVKKEKKEGL